MEVTLVSLSNRPAISDITWPVMDNYCVKHGYTFVAIGDTLDATRHPAWSKLLALKMAMEQGSSDMVVWLDDDQYITNPAIPLDALVGSTPFDRILMTEDSGPWSPFNSGIMFCKNTDEVKDHLDLIYNLAENHPETEKFYQQPMWEQSGMAFFHENIDDKFYRIVPMHPIQGFINEHLIGGGADTLARIQHSAWVPGLFTAHVPGRTLSTRLQQLQSIASVNKWD